MKSPPVAKSRRRTEFGDFQTPEPLAVEVCRLLRRRRMNPASIVEPTCGVGNMLAAAIAAFPDSECAFAADLNAAHVAQARRRLGASTRRAEVIEADFFATDWREVLDGLPEPLLVVGNPPWVCNSALSILNGSNLPSKRNVEGARGIEALTGKSNFDVSLWMILRLLEAVAERRATIAMLCKTSVARKVLLQAARNDLPRWRAALYRIAAQESFGVAVDACLLVIDVGQAGRAEDCKVYSSLDGRTCQSRIGFRDGRLIADAATYDRYRHLFVGSRRRWRSGTKHDCAKVMELRREGRGFRNGLDQLVELESEFLFPMLKSSQITARSATTRERGLPDRWMIVPQRSVADDTAQIQQRAPRTWQYLVDHGARLDRRASSIYRKRPRFSVFGIGPYTFSPWKVAISGLYKQFHFAVVGPHESKPVVFDDTCYFLACRDRREAQRVAATLNSSQARQVFSSVIFWDAKRPITAEILNLVDIDLLVAG